MKALVIILNKKEYLEDILSIFVSHNVKGATILESQGMASAIVKNEISSIPIFGSLKTLLQDSHPYNKTIFTVIKDEVVLQEVVAHIQALFEQEKRPGLGFMFTVPVGEMFRLDQ